MSSFRSKTPPSARRLTSLAKRDQANAPQKSPARRNRVTRNPAMNLGPIREQIDALDKQLVELLNQRLALAAEIGKVKRSAGGQIYVAEREDAVLRKVAAQN